MKKLVLALSIALVPMPAFSQASPLFPGSTQLGYPVTLPSGQIVYAAGVTCVDNTGAYTGCGGSGGGSSGSVTQGTSPWIIGGNIPAGTGKVVALDTGGRLLPGQGIPASSQVTTVASTATQIVAANTGRLTWELETETALTAPLYICLTQTTTCSATVHDRMVPSGTAAGFLYTAPMGFQGAPYYFTTQASVILQQTSWAAQ